MDPCLRPAVDTLQSRRDNAGCYSPIHVHNPVDNISTFCYKI